MTTAPSNGRLHVLRAVEDGWSAFTKAPWSFILFTLLVGILSVIFQLVANAPSTYIEGPIVILLTITGVIGSVLINLWGVIGMVRGSWIALEGTKPDFLDFSHWDGSAAGRLFVRSIALNGFKRSVLFEQGHIGQEHLVHREIDEQNQRDDSWEPDQCFIELAKSEGHTQSHGQND